MLKEFTWSSEGNYYSKKSDKHEVTVEVMGEGYTVSLWKGKTKNLVESQEFKDTSLNSLIRSLALADQLLKQTTKKRG